MSGLIYVVIIALWAAVLIPMWLRRKDRSIEVRSTSEFSAAMQLLSSGASVQTPVGPKDSRVAELGGDEWLWEQHVSYTTEVAAKRRVRALVLLVAVVLLLIVHVLTYVGVSPKWVPILLAVFLLAYLVVTSRVAVNESMHPFAIYEGQRLSGKGAMWSREIPSVDVVHPSPRFDDQGLAWDAVPRLRPPEPAYAAADASGAQGSGMARRSRRDTEVQRRRDTVARKRRDTMTRKRRDTEIQELLLAEELQRRDASYQGRVDYRAETTPLPSRPGRYSSRDWAVNE
ncbi:MAG: hypothetical protein KGP12_08015 [Actinomycetales bacterium]|nr:hypothetical protein [Actinomycetales bacterium]